MVFFRNTEIRYQITCFRDMWIDDKPQTVEIYYARHLFVTKEPLARQALEAKLRVT